jgi:Toastrack DUF4097
MDTHNKLLLTSIAVVGVLGLVGSSMAGRLISTTQMGDAISHGGSHEKDSGQQALGEVFFEKTFEDLDALTVRMEDADVILEESRGDHVTVTFYVDGRGKDAWARDLFERMEFRAEAAGGSLYVESEGPRIARSEWSDHRGFGATVVIGVPGGLDLAVRTGDGDIMAARIAGRAEISSGDGDVVIGTAEGEALIVGTADGDISIGRLSANRAQISTADGDISLGEVRTALAVSTGDGDLRITFAEANEANISTGDGDVVLFVPSTLRASFRLAGEDLEVAAGMELQGRVRDDRIEGDLNGGGPQINVRTGDGSVTLRPHD